MTLDETILWLVLDVNHDSTVEIIGIFDSEQCAVDACKERNHCIGPLVLNRAVYEKRAEWPKARYPLAEQ